jgi:hypothetical protein
MDKKVKKSEFYASRDILQATGSWYWQLDSSFQSHGAGDARMDINIFSRIRQTINRQEVIDRYADNRDKSSSRKFAANIQYNTMKRV